MDWWAAECISQWFQFSPLAGKMREFFCDIYWGNLVRLLKATLNIVGPCFWLGSSGVFNSQELSTLRVQQLIDYSSDFPTTALVTEAVSTGFVLVSHDPLHLPPSNFVPCVLPSSMNPRRPVDFFSVFSVPVRIRWWFPSFLQCRNESRSPHPKITTVLPTIIIPYWFSFWIESYSIYSLGLDAVVQHGL